MTEQYEEDVEEGLLSGQRKTPSISSYGLKHILKRTLPVVLLIGVAVLLVPRRQALHSELNLPGDFRPDWAQYTPYIPQSVYSRPEGCAITQVSGT